MFAKESKQKAQATLFLSIFVVRDAISISAICVHLSINQKLLKNIMKFLKMR